MNDPKNSNHLIAHSYDLYKQTKKDYKKCKANYSPEKCMQLHNKIDHQLHHLSKNITNMSIAVKNKAERKKNDDDPVFLQSKNVGYLGDTNDYQMNHIHQWDYLTFAWIIMTTLCIYFVFVFI
jgi:hypothetical protein